MKRQQFKWIESEPGDINNTHVRIQWLKSFIMFEKVI